MSELIELFKDKNFWIILAIVSLSFLLLFFLIKVIKRKVKGKTIIENKNLKNEPKNISNNKEKKKSKEEEIFINEKNLCVNLYNTLYNIYWQNGYPTDLQNNDVLAYYYQQINDVLDIDSLKIIEHNLQNKIDNITTEFNLLAAKKEMEEKKKILYNKCIEDVIILENLFKLVNINDKTTINNYNAQLLTNNKFATLEEYQNIYYQLEQTIAYIKEEYKNVLSNIQPNGTNTTIDVKLINALKILHCNENERDLNVIKKNYLKLIKKNHPDVNKDSYSSIEVTSNLNEAYNYIKSVLEHKKTISTNDIIDL